MKLLFHADDDDDEQTADPDGSGLGFRRIGTAIGWFSCLSLLLSLSLSLSLLLLLLLFYLFIYFFIIKLINNNDNFVQNLN